MTLRTPAVQPARAAPPRAREGARPDVAWRPLVVLALAEAAVLVAVSGRYGYHRDELYFLAAGQHPAAGYPDLPPFVPLLARAVSATAGGSLPALRAPSAVAAALVVLLTGLLARELGGSRPAQVLAALCVAVSPLLLAVGHLLSTSTYDLLVQTALTLLVARALRTGRERLWLLVGLVAGVGLLVKTLVVFLLAGLAGGVLLAGPRSVLRSRWLWAGGALAVLLWVPDLWWQARHGWPQLAVSRSIAAGGSGTSVSRELFVLYQLLLIGPLLVPVWAAGLWRLLRDPSLRWARCLGWAYVLVLVVFVATGGKPYYLGGLYPALLAAGAVPVTGWAARRRARRRTLVVAVAVSALVSAFLMLPLLPAAELPRTPVLAVNDDAGETIGWPRLVQTLAGVHRALPAADRARAVVLTGNYGEAGAVDRFGPRLGLPRAYSGHDAYGLWGPPPPTGGPVLALGVDERRLRELFASVRPAARVDDGLGVDNTEQDRTVWLCRGLRSSWAASWPRLRRLG